MSRKTGSTNEKNFKYFNWITFFSRYGDGTTGVLSGRFWNSPSVVQGDALYEPKDGGVVQEECTVYEPKDGNFRMM
jgi:hypothetical protein